MSLMFFYLSIIIVADLVNRIEARLDFTYINKITADPTIGYKYWTWMKRV